MLASRPMLRRELKRGEKPQRWAFHQKLRWLAATLVLGPVAYTLFVMYLADPVYRAEATLLIDALSQHSPSGYAPIAQASRDAGASDYQTVYELLKNRTLASLVIREYDLTSASTGSDKPSQEVATQTIEDYLENLEIVPVPGTRLVKVGFSAPDPQLAAWIVNAHVAAAISQNQGTGATGHPRIGNLSLIDKALPAARPLLPRVSSRVLLGIVLGLLGGGGLLYWSRRSDERTLKTPMSVTRHLDLATLCIIPDFSTEEVQAEGSQPLPPQFASFPGVFPKELLLSYHPLSFVPEAYRNLRAELLLSRLAGPPRLVLITSSVNSEGKTLTALNTGISLAQMGARVLVIDADLRHPRCHTVLRTAKGYGLSEFLTGQRPLAEVIQTTRVERLFFLSAGTVPSNPAELLGSKRMQAALSFLCHMYDYVVIDTPPLGLVSDALLVAPLVDGVVLVVNSQTTDYTLVQKTQARLAHVRPKVLGVVLNKVDVKSHEYREYYRRYRAYYRQTGEAQEEQTRLDVKNPIMTATQSQILPTKKPRKTPRKVEKNGEPRLLGNAALKTEQKEQEPMPTEITPETTTSVHAALRKSEDGREKDASSQLLH